MNRFPLVLMLLVLSLLPGVSHAQGYGVDASSHNWLAQRDYSEGNIADGDPATTWAEGATGEGEGEWVSFTFDRPVNLARLAIHNGDQRAESWETCNRVRQMRVDYGHGREKSVTLTNASGVQYVDIQAENVELVKLTIASTYPAENLWNQSVTCISEVGFEVYMTAAEAKAVQAAAAKPARADEPRVPVQVPERPEVVLKKVTLPQSLTVDSTKGDSAPVEPVQIEPIQAEPKTVTAADVQQAALPIKEKQLDWTETLPRQDDQTAAAEPALPLKEPAEPETAPAMQTPLPDAASAEEVVREYYRRLNTLDSAFPDLMAAKVYDQELLSFLYFEEIQKQLGTADKLREAEVDLKDLMVQTAKVTSASAEVRAKGAYVIATPGQKLMVDENSRFDLVLEQGVWKIEKKVEQDG